MAAFRSFYLTFRSPLHIGERGVGLEVTLVHVPADTLFSAICSIWRLFYSEMSLVDDLLSPFKSGRPPFYISSAFPFADRLRFFPKPLLWSDPDPKVAKRLKKVQFVSEGVFRRFISGEPVGFSESNCINGGKALVLSEEKRELAEKLYDPQRDDITAWKQHIVPRVTIDRISNTSNIWQLGQVEFQNGCGLWFGVRFNDNCDDELRSRFETALRVLGDTGLGGERSSGHGLFHVNEREFGFPEIQADRFVTLSPLCPRSREELRGMTDEGAVYELITRRGWISSPEASNLRRRTIWMFKEGSVLSGQPEWGIGQLVNLKPDPSPHDVWRYGYAFPIGVKGDGA